jgi:hypothetical protein
MYKPSAGQRPRRVQLRHSITAGEHGKQEEEDGNDKNSALEKITVAPVNALGTSHVTPLNRSVQF